MADRGRPSKYKEDYNQRVDEYLDTCSREQTKLPTVGEYAELLGINRDTAFEWAKKYSAFSDSIKRIVEKQRRQLMNDGLYGGKEVNNGMAIFLLKANHGMIETEKRVVEIEGSRITLDVNKNEKTEVHDSG